MELPSPTTPEGLFDYLLWGIVALAALIGVALLAFGTY